LIRAVRDKKLSATDSLGILDDAFSLARSGDLSTSSVLRMLFSYCEWKDYNVWLTVCGILSSVENLIESDASKDRLSRFARELLRPVWGFCGWDPQNTDSHSDIFLRSLVIGRLGHFGDPDVTEEAKKRFARFVSGEDLSPNLRGSVMGIAAEHGGAGEWRRLKRLYQSTSLQEEKVRILRALTRFREPGTVEEVLQFSLSGQVRAQDAYVILAGFGSNAKARNAAWKFVKAKWKKIAAMYHGGSVSLLGHILEGSTAAFSDPNELKDAKAFFRLHPVPGTERTRLQTLELIRANISWKKRDRADIEACLLSGSLVQ
jgi:aminopeptidase N